MYINEEEIINRISAKPFHLILEAVEELGVGIYVIGGYVRDAFLNRLSKDIDVVAAGNSIELAKRVAKKIGRGAYPSAFKNFGTARVKAGDLEPEFVGARKESCSHNSRKPVVEDGTLEDDQNRRDFAISALALCLNKERYKELVDPLDGLEDMDELTIRMPLGPDVTFSGGPLRVMRATRFTTQLGFSIDPDTFDAIIRNREHIPITSKGRIADELNKIALSPKPPTGFDLLDKCGLLPSIFPEFCALKGVETKEGIGHKDNFTHTLMVLDRLNKTSDNLWLRRNTPLHGIAKPATKHFDPRLGWTFHSHNFIGEQMIPGIFRKVKLPMNEEMKHMQEMVSLYTYLIALSNDKVTDSTIRRPLFDVGDDIDDLMKLRKADITSKNPEEIRRFLNNSREVCEKLADIEEKDHVCNPQPPISGEEIMEMFSLAPSKPVGVLKEAIKNATLDGVISSEYGTAWQFLIQRTEKMGLKPILRSGYGYKVQPYSWPGPLYEILRYFLEGTVVLRTKYYGTPRIVHYLGI